MLGLKCYLFDAIDEPIFETFELLVSVQPQLIQPLCEPVMHGLLHRVHPFHQLENVLGARCEGASVGGWECASVGVWECKSVRVCRVWGVNGLVRQYDTGGAVE